MSGFVIRVCQKHYFLLVSRGKVNDFLPCFEGKCLLGSCSEPAFRRVLGGRLASLKRLFLMVIPCVRRSFLPFRVVPDVLQLL